MRFEISRDKDGNPAHVCTDDGFMQCSRAFEPDRDGWMEGQLDAFPDIRTGRDMELLVCEVNRLQRENFNLRKESEQWRKAAGFGS